MPSKNNLNSVFTDIAYAIRNKKGSVDLIKPINMADEISNIETGNNTLKTLLDSTKSAKYLFNKSRGPIDNLINYNDTENVTSFEYFLSENQTITSCKSLNLSKGENFERAFYYNGTITKYFPMNTDSVINMDSMFASNFNLQEIDITKLVSGEKNSGICVNDYLLTKFIIRKMDTIPILSSNAFMNCYHFNGTVNEKYNPDGLKDGKFYVPDNKIELLKTSNNWTNYADNIWPLSIVNGDHVSQLFINNDRLSTTEPRKATIYLGGFTNNPTVNITLSNESVAQINNITITNEIIKFEVLALGVDGRSTITVNISGDYSKTLTSEVYYTTPMEYTVEAVDGVTYGFNLNSNNYYESSNKHVNNSYSLCKLVFNTVENNKSLQLQCINSGEINYDYGILSQIDKTLTLGTYDPTNVFKSFKGESSIEPVYITYPETTVGQHFIYIKYIKDGSGNNGNDTLQFKVIS